MPATAAASPFSRSHRARLQHRREGQTWAAISKAVTDAVATLTGEGSAAPNAAAAPLARPHLAAARFLFNRVADRYIAAARTRPGRAWRRRQVARSRYTHAFDTAAWHLQQLEDLSSEGPFHLPELFQHFGALPLIAQRVPVSHRAQAAA
ncbi:hypothetical protein [Streptomyces sp. NPDC015125]|uniref:hypothetical protein n=1 Tax=Streptomyces sp. NPDC015125 TaxID=3364938 RepID=UPI0036FD254C